MNGEKLTPITNKPSLWALSPLLVFLCLYLVTSIIVNDFYKVPITIAFMVSSVYAVCITKGLSLNERMLQYSIGAANKNIMLMIWISCWIWPGSGRSCSSPATAGRESAWPAGRGRPSCPCNPRAVGI